MSATLDQTDPLPRHSLAEIEHVEKPLWWQQLVLSYTASGYGKKIPTRHMIRLPGDPIWRRVYCYIYSNAGTCYVAKGDGTWLAIIEN